MQTQSIIFNRNFFDKPHAKLWLATHGFISNYKDKSESPRVTDRYLRYRQKDPLDFNQKSFRTIKITSGIKGIVGITV